MLIIPKDILFKHATANNVQYLSDRKPFDHQMGGVSCIIDLIGLITSTDFNRFEVSIYREKSIPMTALWCPAFSNHG